MKRILSVLLSVAMLLSVIPMNAIASDNVFEKNFNDDGTVSAIGGKSASDKSCSVNQDFYEAIVLNDTVTVEYSLFHTTDYLNHLAFVYSTAQGNNLFTKIFDTNGSGKLKFCAENNKAYFIEDNRWIRIALTFNPKSDTNNLTLFFNGVETATTTIPTPVNEAAKLRTVFKQTCDYIDDLRIYHGAYTAPQSPILTGKNGASVTEKTISLPADTTLSNISDKITVENGSFAGVADVATNLTKTVGTINSGDLVAVLASDGYTFSYYTAEVAAKPDSTPVFIKDYNEDGAVSGIGGKASDDKSLSSKADYYEVATLSSKITLEYNLWNSNKDYLNHLTYIYKDGSNNLVYQKILCTRYNGKIMFAPTNANLEIPSSRWIRIAVTYDPNISTSNLIWYVDGVQTAIATVPQPMNSSTKLRITFDQANNYIDDVKVYYGDYSALAAPSLSESNGASVSGTVISLPDGAAASNIADFIAVENGTILGVADGETFKTVTDVALKDNDLIVFAAQDGVTYTTYTVKILKTKSFENDFTNLVESSEANVWPKQPSGIEYLCPGYAATGIGGKAADDISIDLQKENAYYRLDTTLYGTSTIEFSILKKDTTNCFAGPSGQNRWLLFGHSGRIFDSGSVVQEEENIVGSYRVGQWNRAAIEVNFKTGTFNAYVNGDKLIENKPLPAQIVEGTLLKMYFQGYCYIDDVCVYSGTYKGGTAPTIESGDNYTVKSQYKFIVTDNTFAVADAENIFGATAVVSDSETFATKTEGNIEIGDYVSVASDDGLIRTYYTVVAPDSISDIEIIKDGALYTKVVAESGTYAAKVHVCETDSAAYTLYIAKYNGSKLTDIQFVNITNGSGRYIDDDYTTAEITVEDGESVKVFLWNKSDLSPIKKREIPVF